MKSGKWIIASLLFLFATATVNAQTEQRRGGDRQEMKDKKEKVEQLKREYIETELKMTDAEKSKFWPVYDELETKIKEQRKKEMKIGKDLKENFDKYSDAELKAKTDEVFAIQEKMIALRKEYLQKYAAILGQKRATKVLHLEREFKKELVKRMRDGQAPRNDRQAPPPPPMEE